MTHELMHVVAAQRLKHRMMALLNEGLAEYGMAQIAQVSRCTGIRVPIPLGVLAHNRVFYEWRYVENPDYPPDAKYAHAAALADYLISRYSMDKFKELCLQTAYEANQDPSAQLHKAVATIYGISLRDLEQNWRREWISPGQIQLSLDLPDAG